MQISRTAATASELGQPDAKVWQQTRRQRIELIGTPIALQPSAYITSVWRDRPVGRTRAVEFSALHNGDVLALRLAWASAQPMNAVNDNDHFADGAAVMFPVGADAPLVTMGSTEQPVNAWHWRADRPQQAHSNVAQGLGSTRVTPDVAIPTQAMHQQGRWQLVFLRQLGVLDGIHAQQVVSLAAGQRSKIAFAVWDGSAAERAGLKAFSPAWLDIELA